MMMRKMISMFASIALVAGLCPAAAFAGEATPLSAGRVDVVGAEPLSPQSHSAAKARKSVSYKMKKYVTVKKYSYVRGKYVFVKPVIKGHSNVAKKINRSLNERYKASLPNKKAILSYAKSAITAYGNESYYSTTRTVKTYNKRGYISFKYKNSWYAGGVFNGSYAGDVYSLKSGKKLNVAQVVSGNAYSVKQKIARAYMNKRYNGSYDSTAYNDIMNTKITDFDFYLKGGKVVVCFGPYPPGVGNYPYFTVTLQGNYA